MTRNAATVRKLRAARPGAPTLVAVVVVGCSCGMFPMEHATHRTSGQAWTAAAAHVAKNPTKCQPSMNRDHIPAGLAALLPVAPDAPAAGLPAFTLAA